jgi:quinol monooxygenase YgiN
VSVLVVVKVSGNTDTFQKALADRADEFTAVRDRAVAQGAKHHRFGIGDGYVVAIDEWEDAERFEAFFADPEMQAFVASIGAEAAPVITVAEAIASPDEF